MSDNNNAAEKPEVVEPTNEGPNTDERRKTVADLLGSLLGVNIKVREPRKRPIYLNGGVTIDCTCAPVTTKSTVTIDHNPIIRGNPGVEVIWITKDIMLAHMNFFCENKVKNELKFAGHFIVKEKDLNIRFEVEVEMNPETKHIGWEYTVDAPDKVTGKLTLNRGELVLENQRRTFNPKNGKEKRSVFESTFYLWAWTMLIDFSEMAEGEEKPAKKPRTESKEELITIPGTFTYQDEMDESPEETSEVVSQENDARER